jgi:hypothetical protein
MDIKKETKSYYILVKTEQSFAMLAVKSDEDLVKKFSNRAGFDVMSWSTGAVAMKSVVSVIEQSEGAVIPINK